MGKKIITHSNGVVETRETFYTEETVNQLKQQIEEKIKRLKDLKFLKKHIFLINYKQVKKIYNNFNNLLIKVLLI